MEQMAPEQMGPVEVASASLDYQNKRVKGVKAESERVKIPASNGNSFSVFDNNKITLTIAPNQSNTFLDVMSSYIKFEIENGHSAEIFLDGNTGAYGLIKQVEILSGSAVISQINDYDRVIDQMVSTSLNDEYRAGFGNITQGLRTSANAWTGTDITNGESRVVCLPLYALPIYQEKLLPLFGRSEIRINLYLNAPARAFRAVATVTNTAVSVNNPEFVAYQVVLKSDAMETLLEENGGKFEIMTQDIMTIPQSVSTTDRTLVSNLGFNMSSLNKLTFAYYPTSLNTQAQLSSNRAKRSLTEFNFLVNGSKYPRNPVQVSADSAAEAAAELAIANKALADGKFEPSLNPARFVADDPTGATSIANVGEFVASLDLEALREHDEHALFSGLGTNGATTALQQQFSADGSTSCTLVAVAYFEKSISLDMAGSQTFTVSQ